VTLTPHPLLVLLVNKE